MTETYAFLSYESEPEPAPIRERLMRPLWQDETIEAEHLVFDFDIYDWTEITNYGGEYKYLIGRRFNRRLHPEIRKVVKGGGE